ncbi:HAD-IA family hydrolase [Paraglaciecola agarilytica]|uniref:HAD-IA family hydrolase n=1 Tax=Paraglaciecola chathamensis TaxID=368405 RepID=UPI001C0A4755|nr:HAD-IA family hydrolase [Paraglaciecola agarilytica]MBU3020130.1 HAD-IA family hydrolase [Paraglaciecola agarilytica]
MIYYRKIGDIKALTFDLDDTLYDNYPYIIRAEHALIEFLGGFAPEPSHSHPGYWREHRLSTLKNKPELHSDMGMLRREVLTSGIQAFGHSGQALKSAVDEAFDFFYFERSNFKVAEEVTQTLSKLGERWPLVAITNGNVNLEQIGIADYFQKSFHASLAFPMKPNSAMFDAAQQLLKMPRESILHVGDNLEKDVLGAKKAGFMSAWYAVNRPMRLSSEDVTVLPDIQLEHLSELCDL